MGREKLAYHNTQEGHWWMDDVPSWVALSVRISEILDSYC
jgi:hypothetical protein